MLSLNVILENDRATQNFHHAYEKGVNSLPSERVLDFVIEKSIAFGSCFLCTVGIWR